MVGVARVVRRNAADVRGRHADVGVAAARGVQVSKRVVPHHVLLLPHEAGRADLHAHMGGITSAQHYVSLT